MSEIIDEETAAKLIKHMRKNDQDSPHLQATFVNFIWSMHEGSGDLDAVELADGEVEEIMSELPTNPRNELDHMDETVFEPGDTP